MESQLQNAISLTSAALDKTEWRAAQPPCHGETQSEATGELSGDAVAADTAETVAKETTDCEVGTRAPCI
jgi:hypothetical protein